MISAIVYIMYLGENHGFSLELLMCSTTCTSLARQVMTAAALGLPPELNNPLGIPSPKQPTKLWATWNTGRGMWGCSSLTLALLLYLAFSLTKQWVFEQCSAQRGDIGRTWTKNQPSCTSTESLLGANTSVSLYLRRLADTSDPLPEGAQVEPHGQGTAFIWNWFLNFLYLATVEMVFTS